MTRNTSNIDRIVRAAFALAVLILYLMGKITGNLALGLGIVAAILLITSLIGFCPIYRILGISSCKIKDL